MSRRKKEGTRESELIERRWGMEKKGGERLKEERGGQKKCGKSTDPRLGHVILIS